MLFNALVILSSAPTTDKKNAYFLHSRKAGYAVSKTCYYFFRPGFYFVGHAITSPAKSFTAARQAGTELGNKYFSFVLAALSGMITVFSYFIISPVIGKLIMSSVLPFISSHTSVDVSRFTANSITPILAPLGKARIFIIRFLKLLFLRCFKSSLLLASLFSLKYQ